MANGYCINWKRLEVNQNNDGTPVHPLVALMFSTMVGGLFVVFLPFIGLYMFAGFLAKKAGLGLGSLFETAIAPQAAPGAAYLTGSESKGSPAAESTLEKLAKEVEAARVDSKP